MIVNVNQSDYYITERESDCYGKQTLEAMKEARRISRDPAVKEYTSMEELKRALDD